MALQGFSRHLHDVCCSERGADATPRSFLEEAHCNKSNTRFKFAELAKRWRALAEQPEYLKGYH
jgi:hypothetical protein